jgi:ATP-dependent RNA helicase RhlE
MSLDQLRVTPGLSFDQLGLAPELLHSVAKQGYTEPTPVQREAIPLVLAGSDVLAGAQTGTGKTAAFVLPILQRLTSTRGVGHANGRRAIRVLVLTPTRELALQVEESFRTYGAQRPVSSTAIYGGVGFDQQVRRLRQGPDVVVATPGRLLDHAGQRTIDLSLVEVMVLDEADRMLDMGFIHDVRKILALVPAQRQTLLFSATFSNEIRRLAADFLRNAAMVQVTPRNTAPTLVHQVVLPVDRERKRELLSKLIRSGRIEQALVFTRTKHGANRLAEQLVRDGIAAAAIHGNKSQSQRVRALSDFKAGRAAILVATDIAARGLDIDALPHVVNFELPMVPEDYVHRIGRTGRAGIDGDAVALVCVDERPLLASIERLLGHPIETEIIPGFEPDPRVRPEPIRLRSGMAQGQSPRGGRPGSRPFNGPRHGVDQRPAAAQRHGIDQRPAAGQRHGTDQRPAAAQRHSGMPYPPAPFRSGIGRPLAPWRSNRPTSPEQPHRPAGQGAPQHANRGSGQRQGGQRQGGQRQGGQRQGGGWTSLPGERLARD